MKLLNADLKMRGAWYDAEPQGRLIDVWGRPVLLDCNSLGAVLLDSPEEQAQIPLINQRPQFPPLAHPAPRMLVLNVTHACTLHCRYCFVRECYPDGKSRPASMTAATAKRALRTLLPNTVDHAVPPGVAFFGGEPLLAWPLIQEMAPYAQGYFAGQPLRLSVTTNGTLLTRSRAEWLVAHGFNYIVSIDGPAELHDAARPMADGGGSYGAAHAGLEELQRAGARDITLRGTYHKEATELLRRVEHLNALCDLGLGHQVSMEPLSLSETACVSRSSPLALSPGDITRMTDEFHALARWVVERLRAGKPARLHALTLILQRLMWTVHSPTECGAGCGALSVSPDGSIHACHREMGTRIGHLDKGGIDEIARMPWVENRSYRSAVCRRCSIRYVCGGGCRQAAVTHHGRMDHPYAVGCALMQQYVKVALYILMEVPADVLAAAYPDPVETRQKALELQGLRVKPLQEDA